MITDKQKGGYIIMRKWKRETKKTVYRIVILIMAVIMVMGFVLLPAMSAGAQTAQGDAVVSSFETGSLREAIDKACNGTDLNLITRIAVSGGTMNADDYSAVCGYPNIEYLELAGCETENGIIPDYALASRNQLTYVSLPSNTVKIGAGAFSGNRSLLKLSMPSSVREIGDSAFEGCEKVTEFNVPAELEVLGTAAFSDCKALESFAVPEKITEIPDSCFSKCALTELHLGPQVTRIGSNAFSDAHSLTDIYYYGDTPFSADQSAFQNLKVTIHVYDDLEGFDGLESNFVSVAYDMSEDSVYIPPKSENGENDAADTESAANDADAAETAAEDSSQTEETAQSENAAQDSDNTESADETAAAAASSSAESGGFSTLSVIVIAVLCVAVGVLAALLAVRKK